VTPFQVIYSFIYCASASRRVFSPPNCFCCLCFWDIAVHVPSVRTGSQSLDAEPVGEFQVIYLLCFCIKGSFIHCFCCLYYWDMAVHVPSIRMGSQSLDAEPVGAFQVIYSFIYCASASRGVLSIVFAVYTSGIWQYTCLPYVRVLRVWM